jgi:hypothetical protein
MIKIISFSCAVLLTCLKSNAQVIVSDQMMTLNPETGLVDSTSIPEVNTNLVNVIDQLMPLKVIEETGGENKNQFSNEGQSLPEKASDKMPTLPPKKEE